jgi:hypothetical protein
MNIYCNFCCTPIVSVLVVFELYIIIIIKIIEDIIVLMFDKLDR